VAGHVRFLLTDEDTWRMAQWESLRHVIDVSAVDADTGLALRVWDVVQAIVSLGFVAIFTALVLTRFLDMLADARSGRTRLSMDADVLVIGWSDRVLTYLREIQLGPGDLLPRRYRVALLVEPTDSWTVQDIREAINEEAAADDIEIEIRVGASSDLSALARVRAAQTPRILITSEPSDRSDSHTVLTVFALLRLGFDFRQQRCVAEMFTRDGEQMALAATGGALTVVNPTTILSLLVAQAVRSQGMSQVVDQLISYRGCEVYFAPVPDELVGRRFDDVVRCADNGSPIGLLADGNAVVRPPMDQLVGTRDQLIFIAQNARTPSFGRIVPPGDGGELAVPVVTWDSSRILILGWSDVAAISVRHLGGFLGQDSSIEIMVCTPLARGVSVALNSKDPRLAEVERYATVSGYHRAIEERLTANRYDVVAVVPYREGHTPAESDAYTMMAMAVVRKVVEALGHDTKIVGELRASAHQTLAEVAAPDDLIVSEALAAAFAVQLMDRPQTQQVLADLLDYRGSAFYVRPLSTFDVCPEDTYGTVVDEAVARGEIAIGLRIGGLIELNPNRGAPLGAASGLVVIARGTVDGGVQADLSSVVERWTE
jgi:hypothetical protein